MESLFYAYSTFDQLLDTIEAEEIGRAFEHLNSKVKVFGWGCSPSNGPARATHKRRGLIFANRRSSKINKKGYKI